MGELDDLRDEWTQLAKASRNVFSSWEWAATWWRHFGRGRELCVLPGPDLLLPLYAWRTTPLRILRLLGHGPGDELGPVCAPDRRNLGAAALATALRDDGCDLFLGDELPAATAWPGRIVARTASPVARLVGSWDDFLAARSSNFRQQIRRRERALRRDHRVRFRLTERASLDRDLTTLFALHRARWGASPWFAPLEPFHREFAAVALELGWLRLWILELDDAPAAAWLGYRFAGVESYYQAGRDPAHDRAAAGFVLLAHTIREALLDGMDEYRFLRGDEPYKYRFADSDPGLVTVGWARGLRGRSALALRQLRRRLP